MDTNIFIYACVSLILILIFGGFVIKLFRTNDELKIENKRMEKTLHVISETSYDDTASDVARAMLDKK